MTVEPILPDAPPVSAMPGDESFFAQALDAVSDALTNATHAEDAFAYGSGTLHDAIYRRAQADVALAVATATAQRLAQAVQSVLTMQV